jgi:fatty-acyl-CoA synthase
MAAAVGMSDAHAGELPGCYVTLKPGAQVGQEELRAHAQRSIAGRPAWPKHIFVVDAIPTISVGKIYKPQLRVDAATRLVQHIVQGEHNFRGARIEVTEGGKRGLRVSVILAEAHSSGAPQLRQALAASFLNRPCALAERSGSIERHTLLATLARGAGAAAPSAP